MTKLEALKSGWAKEARRNIWKWSTKLNKAKANGNWDTVAMYRTWIVLEKRHIS